MKIDLGGGDVSVSFKDVSVSYRSVKGEPKKIYEQMNLELLKGEKIALIGSNGAGKINNDEVDDRSY